MMTLIIQGIFVSIENQDDHHVYSCLELNNVPIILWKESLHSDGKKFHQFINKTNNHLSLLNIKKMLLEMMLQIQVMPWDRHKNVAGLNQLMGFQSSLSWKLDLQLTAIHIAWSTDIVNNGQIMCKNIDFHYF